jgi:hypothetical protein
MTSKFVDLTNDAPIDKIKFAETLTAFVGNSDNFLIDGKLGCQIAVCNDNFAWIQFSECMFLATVQDEKELILTFMGVKFENTQTGKDVMLFDLRFIDELTLNNLKQAIFSTIYKLEVNSKAAILTNRNYEIVVDVAEEIRKLYGEK